MSHREKIWHRVGEADAHHQGGHHEGQGEDHHGGHQVDQVIQAEGQHQPVVSQVIVASPLPPSPVENVIFLICKEKQGHHVPHHANAGHSQQHHPLHKELKGQGYHQIIQPVSAH